MAAGWQADLEAILSRGRSAGAFSGGEGSFVKRLAALMNGFAVQILERTRTGRRSSTSRSNIVN